MLDKPPWHRKEPTNIWTLYKSSSQSGGMTKYDYTESLTREGGSLQAVVYDLLSRTHEGHSARAEFRLCADFQGLSSKDTTIVHVIPHLSEGTPRCTTTMAKTLRPDQESALHFVVQSEETPKMQNCVFAAHVKPKFPAMQLGSYACLREDYMPGNSSRACKAEWDKLNMGQLSHVGSRPGEVIEMLRVDTGDIIAVELLWRFPEGDSFSFMFPKKFVQTTSVPAKLCLGGCVRLVRNDGLNPISCDDVGVLTKLDDVNIEVFFPQCPCWKGLALDVVSVAGSMKLRYVEIRIYVEYRIFGSLCGMKMGWGKTPLMAALVKYRCDQASSAKSCSPSLIVVPSKLFKQWINELQSWLGMQFLNNSSSWLKTVDGKITLWAPATMGSFKATDAYSANRADIVLLQLNMFASDSFPLEHDQCYTNIFNIYARKWNRLILDEAHEVSAVPLVVQRRLMTIQYNALHLLSATPQQGSGSRGAASLTKLFKASLFPDRDEAVFRMDNDDSVTAAASEFFRTFARTMDPPVVLPVVERVVKVTLSQAEKVLYADFVTHENPTKRQLLEKCCCFVKDSTAAKEIGVLINQKRIDFANSLDVARSKAALVLLLANRLDSVEHLHARRMKMESPVERREYWEHGKTLVDNLFVELQQATDLKESVRTDHVYRLNGPVTNFYFVREKTGMTRALIKSVADLLNKLCDRSLSEDYVKRMYQEQSDIPQLSHDYVHLGTMKKSLDFLERSIEELRGGGGSCSVCLDDLENGEAICMTKCGHVFHESCLRDVRELRPECPNCRQAVQDFYSTQPSKPLDPWLKYGTKLKAMIEALKNIKRDYPGERVLLFVQYENMRRKLENAFTEFNVPYLRLVGTTIEIGKTIDRWQNNKNPDDFLMMLSSEEHNSGITLTRRTRSYPLMSAL